ncbi:MAG: ABC transporter substrate-binding protein [Eubacteriales bacterium]|nr:ABC transporter substrate-binding protein [Eubacteriales bacterium]
MNKQFISRNLAIVIAIALLISTLALAGCTANTKPETVVKFADAGWDSIQLHNAIAAYVVQNGYGLQTEQITGTTPITWKALTENELQIYMEVWSENISSYQDDVTSGLIKEVSVNFDDNAQGLYVPRYVIEGDAERGIPALAPDLKTVEDLAKYSDVFADSEEPAKGRMYGAVSGWEVDKILNNKYYAYGLDKTFNYFQPGSDAALASSLVAAYEKGEPWVGYYWEPTWISGQYELVLLEDKPYTSVEDMNAGLTEFPANRVTICVNPKFAEENPDVVTFLSKYQTSSALTAEALSVMNSEKIDASQAAIWFLKNHDDLLKAWVTDDKVYQKITKALAAEK